MAVQRGPELELVPLERPITIQDLLRHTSGFTYEFRGPGPVQKMYMAAKVYRRSQSNADQVASLGKLPLLHQPGTRWEYGRSTDVVGRLVEVLSGQRLATSSSGTFWRRSAWSTPHFTCRTAPSRAPRRGLRQ